MSVWRRGGEHCRWFFSPAGSNERRDTLWDSCVFLWSMVHVKVCAMYFPRFHSSLCQNTFHQGLCACSNRCLPVSLELEGAEIGRSWGWWWWWWWGRLLLFGYFQDDLLPEFSRLSIQLVKSTCLAALPRRPQLWERQTSKPTKNNTSVSSLLSSPMGLLPRSRLCLFSQFEFLYMSWWRC